VWSLPLDLARKTSPCARLAPMSSPMCLCAGIIVDPVKLTNAWPADSAVDHSAVIFAASITLRLRAMSLSIKVAKSAEFLNDDSNPA